MRWVYFTRMKPQADNNYAEAFCLVCRSYQLSPTYVLQTFADAISVYGFLNPHAEPATYLASKIVLCFSKSYQPVVAIDPLKRKRAILNIRYILKMLQSLTSNEQKEASFQQLSENWFKANRIKGAGSELYFADTLSILLPKGLLLECDILRCHRQDLLNYFMGLIVQEVQETAPDGVGLPFLLYCTSLVYPVENN